MPASQWSDNLSVSGPFFWHQFRESVTLIVIMVYQCNDTILLIKNENTNWKHILIQQLYLVIYILVESWWERKWSLWERFGGENPHLPTYTTARFTVIFFYLKTSQQSTIRGRKNCRMYKCPIALGRKQEKTHFQTALNQGRLSMWRLPLTV